MSNMKEIYKSYQSFSENNVDKQLNAQNLSLIECWLPVHLFCSVTFLLFTPTMQFDEHYNRFTSFLAESLFQEDISF